MAKVEAPPPRDYGQETRDILESQIDLADEKYASEATYRPKYAALDLDILGRTLRGEESSPGLLELYEQDIAPTLSRTAEADRRARMQGDIDLLSAQAPIITRTLREASGNAPIIDLLNKQAIEELEAGASLDPSLAHTVAQGVRAGQASRGFGWGQPDVVQEAWALGERGQALRDNRRQFASGVVGLNQVTGGDPVMTLLGRPSQTLGMVPGVAGQGAAFNPGNIFNAESAYGADVFNTNYNAEAASRIASANLTGGILGGLLGFGGSLGGGWLASRN